MIIDKYNRINIDKLPADIAAEFKQIANDTDNFEDDELVEIYKDNFNDLFKIVEEKYPDALKPKAKLIKKSDKKKIVKKAEPKKKIVSKKQDKIALKSLTIHSAEGISEKFPKEYKTWQAANKAVLPVYEDFVNSGSVGYNKVHFTVTFEDGEEYAGGRLSVSEKSDNPTKTNNVFGLHIKKYLDYYVSDESSASEEKKKETKEWLQKYDLGLDSDKKPAKKSEPIGPTGKDTDDILNKLKQPDENVFKVGDEIYAYNDDQLTQTWSKVKTKDQNKKYSGVITKKKKGVYPGQFNYYVKTKDSEIFLSGRYAQSEPIGPTGKDIDLSMLVGKQIEVYIQGVKEPKTSKITGATVDDPKFSTRAVHIETGKNREYEFPLSKLEAFLEGKEITPKHDGDAFVIVLKNASEIDCETAIAEIKAIHAKRDAAAKKRADAPKKKVTTAAREKQIKTFTSVFKTKEFKADKKQAEGFAKDIVAVYNKYGLKSMAEQLEKDIQELIDSKYKK